MDLKSTVSNLYKCVKVVIWFRGDLAMAWMDFFNNNSFIVILNRFWTKEIWFKLVCTAKITIFPGELVNFWKNQLKNSKWNYWFISIYAETKITFRSAPAALSKHTALKPFFLYFMARPRFELSMTSHSFNHDLYRVNSRLEYKIAFVLRL